MIHRSRIDWWLAVLVGLALLVSVAGGAFVLLAPHVPGPAWPGALGLGVGLLLCLVVYPMRYEIAAGRLQVRSGLLRWSVPLSAVVAARLSSNPLSAPAMSLRRVRIDYRRPDGKRGFQLISPRDREAFLRELAGADPGLVLDERAWVVRRAGEGAA